MKLLLLPLLVATASCAQMRRHVAQGSTPQAQQTMDAVDLEWSALEKVDEDAPDNHALVTDKESEDTIAQAMGGDPDRAEAVEDDRAPMPFLKKVRTKRVQFWIDYFTQKQRDRFQRFLNNGALYRPIIERIMDEQGVPRELFFVGLIESGYYLGAHSHASAVGPWQFIRGTGKRYGLAITRDMDERRDIFKATRAAAQYFKDLHNIFSSWELALAAYNAGEYGIIRRIQRHKTRDYYELSRKRQIPEETVNYVPKVLAAMHVLENAGKYGFTFPHGAGQFWQKTKSVRAPKGTQLRTLSQRLGVSETLLAKLNPELRYKHTPRQHTGSYMLRVPADRHTEWMDTLVADAPVAAPREKEIETLKDRMDTPLALASRVPAAARRPTLHTVRRGENLTMIARRHRTTLRELARWNNLRVNSQVRIGQKLKLEAPTGPVTEVVSRKAAKPNERTPVKVAAASGTPIALKVKKGDTLEGLSRLFGVSVQELKRANNLKRPRRLLSGKKLRIPGSRRGTYTVRRGDGLLKVARKFEMNHLAIIRLNDLKGQDLHTGQRLVVNLE